MTIFCFFSQWEDEENDSDSSEKIHNHELKYSK